MPEDQIIRSTIRLSLLLYAATVCGQIVLTPRLSDTTAEGSDHRTYRINKILRGLWTAGCVLLLAHMATAFQWTHDWSHTRAYDDTARQTCELLGWRFGAGVYVNYLFAAVWAADTFALWTLGVERYARRSRWLVWSLHAFMLFIIFNATVTFKTGAVRYVAIAFLIAMAAGLVRSHFSRSEPR